MYYEGEPIDSGSLETYPTAIDQLQSRASHMQQRLVICRFNRLKRLQDPRNEIQHLRQCELLAKADSRSTTKGDIFPPVLHPISSAKPQRKAIWRITTYITRRLSQRSGRNSSASSP